MLVRTTRLGAPSPVGGMNRLETQHDSENTMISSAKKIGIAAVLRREPADDGAEQDGHEGRAFDQRVAGRQFGALQMIGQDAVFDRTEQRRDHAEQEQRDEQQRDRVQQEADHREERDADLDELEPLRHQRLVEAVGDLAAERRQEEERCDEHRAR